MGRERLNSSHVASDGRHDFRSLGINHRELSILTAGNQVLSVTGPGD
jgi:hypothetical protein